MIKSSMPGQGTSDQCMTRHHDARSPGPVLQICAIAGFRCNLCLESNDFLPQPACARFDQKLRNRLVGLPFLPDRLVEGDQTSTESSAISIISSNEFCRLSDDSCSPVGDYITHGANGQCPGAKFGSDAVQASGFHVNSEYTMSGHNIEHFRL